MAQILRFAPRPLARMTDQEGHFILRQAVDRPDQDIEPDLVRHQVELAQVIECGLYPAGDTARVQELDVRADLVRARVDGWHVFGAHRADEKVTLHRAASASPIA